MQVRLVYLQTELISCEVRSSLKEELSEVLFVIALYIIHNLVPTKKNIIVQSYFL